MDNLIRATNSGDYGCGVRQNRDDRQPVPSGKSGPDKRFRNWTSPSAEFAPRVLFSGTRQQQGVLRGRLERSGDYGRQSESDTADRQGEGSW